ncbi:hypothetical protein AB0L44_09245 [Nonomuraea wenchangensis]|uniref:hypothetical protein n=1 Tax=Nonomuraea wenchangensis TaxID=568860 RepID=UPI00342A1196
MVMLSPPFSAPPTWLDELRMCAVEPHSRWSAYTHTSILGTAKELNQWLNQTRPYTSAQKDGWLSILTDFEHSASLAGPEITQAAGPDYGKVLALTQSLGNAFNAIKKEALVAAHLATALPAAQTTMQAFLDRFTDADLRKAAWRDMLAACRDLTSPRNVIAIRRDFFWELLQIANYDLTRMSSTLCGILGDLKHDIDEARIWLGDAGVAVSDRSFDFTQAASMPESQRLTLCERLTTASAASAHHVVWLAYENADIHRVDVGQRFCFYGSMWVRGNLERGEGANYDSLPSELKTSDGWFSYTVLPDDVRVELVRVDLGREQFTDPVQAAREEVENLVTLASHRVDNSSWRRLDGYLHAIDGRIKGIGVFRSADFFTKQAQYHQPDNMRTALQELHKSIGSRLPITDPSLIETIEAVRHWKEAKDQSPLAAIILNVRILELLSARVSHGSWHSYLDEYFAKSWVKHRMHWEIEAVTYMAVHADKYGTALSANTLQEIAQLKQSIFSKSPASGQRADLRAAVAALPRLTALHTSREQHFGRRLHTLATHLSSVSSTTHWRDELMSEWNLIRRRLQRVRNCLAHGGPIEPSTAETAHKFAVGQTDACLDVSLRGLLASSPDIKTEHQKYQQDGSSWFDSLDTFSSVEAALGL